MKRDPMDAVVTFAVVGAVGYIAYRNWDVIKATLGSVKLTHTKDDAVLTVASGAGNYVSPDGTAATDAGAAVTPPVLSGVPSTLPGLSDIFTTPTRVLTYRGA